MFGNDVLESAVDLLKKPEFREIGVQEILMVQSDARVFTVVIRKRLGSGENSDIFRFLFRKCEGRKIRFFFETNFQTERAFVTKFKNQSSFNIRGPERLTNELKEKIRNARTAETSNGNCFSISSGNEEDVFIRRRNNDEELFLFWRYLDTLYCFRQKNINVIEQMNFSFFSPNSFASVFWNARLFSLLVRPKRIIPFFARGYHLYNSGVFFIGLDNEKRVLFEKLHEEIFLRGNYGREIVIRLSDNSEELVLGEINNEREVSESYFFYDTALWEAFDILRSNRRGGFFSFFFYILFFFLTYKLYTFFEPWWPL